MPSVWVKLQAHADGADVSDRPDAPFDARLGRDEAFFFHAGWVVWLGLSPGGLPARADGPFVPKAVWWSSARMVGR